MIYVDDLVDYGWRLGPSCHMWTDSEDLEELHKFAELIGLKRSWFQDKRLKHYDLVESKRKLAVANGAVEDDGTQIRIALRKVR